MIIIAAQDRILGLSNIDRLLVGNTPDRITTIQQSRFVQVLD